MLVDGISNNYSAATYSPAYNPGHVGDADKASRENETVQKANPVTGVKECETCATRRYQDGSNDPGVSFKSPTKLNPAQAASQVFSHEREHYTRENAKAEDEGREVLSNEIKVFTAVCPECGKTYVSGGETTTVTRADEERGDFALKFFDQILRGQQAELLDILM